MVADRPRLCINGRLGFCLSDEGVPAFAGVMPAPSRHGVRDRQLFSFLADEAASVGVSSEVRAYAAKALIARIIAPMPRMRMTRFRL